MGGMKYGYARTSTDDQTTALQLAALKRARCSGPQLARPHNDAGRPPRSWREIQFAYRSHRHRDPHGPRHVADARGAARLCGVPHNGDLLRSQFRFAPEFHARALPATRPCHKPFLSIAGGANGKSEDRLGLLDIDVKHQHVLSGSEGCLGSQLV